MRRGRVLIGKPGFARLEEVIGALQRKDLRRQATTRCLDALSIRLCQHLQVIGRKNRRHRALKACERFCRVQLISCLHVRLAPDLRLLGSNIGRQALTEECRLYRLQGFAGRSAA